MCVCSLFVRISAVAVADVDVDVVAARYSFLFVLLYILFLLLCILRFCPSLSRLCDCCLFASLPMPLPLPLLPFQPSVRTHKHAYVEMYVFVCIFLYGSVARPFPFLEFRDAFGLSSVFAAADGVDNDVVGDDGPVWN